MQRRREIGGWMERLMAVEGGRKIARDKERECIFTIYCFYCRMKNKNNNNIKNDKKERKEEQKTRKESYQQ